MNRTETPRAVLATVAIALFLCAYFGYDAYLPSDTPRTDVAFYALNLLALNFKIADAETVPLALQIARFGVHVVAVAAVALAISSIGRRRLDLWWGGRASQHVAIIGEHQVSVALARAYRREGTKVALIVESDRPRPSIRPDRKLRILQVHDPAQLRRVASGADRLVVAGSDDDDTVRLLAHFTPSPDEPRASVGKLHALVSNLELAVELERFVERVEAGTWDIVSVPDRVASKVLPDYPPRAAGERAVVVVGAGSLAAAVTRRLARGWYLAADPLRIHCLGPELSWTEDVAVELETIADLRVGRPTPSLPRLRDAIRDRLREAGVGPHGPKGLIFLAGLDKHTTFILGGKLAAHLDHVEVVALLDEPSGWTDLVESPPSLAGRLHVRAASTELASPGALQMSRVDRLAAAIVADSRNWPDDIEGVLAAAAPDHERESRARVLAMGAEGAFQDAGFITGGANASPVVLLPRELVVIATRLASALGPDGPADRYLWFEFAATLPALFARVGLDFVRLESPPVRFDDERVERMAQEVHEIYRRTQRPENHSGSELSDLTWEQLRPFARESNRAQVRDLPVKLGAVGRTIVEARGEPDTSWLDDATLRVLAIWEHRRWEYFHRSAGYVVGPETNHDRRVHKALRSWRDIGQMQELDLESVRRIPDLLAHAGLDTAPLPDGLRSDVIPTIDPAAPSA